MNAKLSNFSELSNILSVKSSLRTNLMALFTRFGLGHLLCKLSLEKEAGIPAVQLNSIPKHRFISLVHTICWI